MFQTPAESSFNGEPSTEMNFLASSEDLAGNDDFALFKATGHGPITQPQLNPSDLFAGNTQYADSLYQYPAPDSLTAPNHPYFADSSNAQIGLFDGSWNQGAVQYTPSMNTDSGVFNNFTDFFQDQTLPLDPELWNESFDQPVVSQPYNDQAFPCSAHSVQGLGVNELWSPHSIQDDQIVAHKLNLLQQEKDHQPTARPPPLPLHSKPNNDPSGCLQEKSSLHRGAAPVAPMYSGASSSIHPDDILPWTPTIKPVERKPLGSAITPVRRGRKRKAMTAADISSEAIPVVSDLNKRLKIEEVATKMAYANGLVKRVKPGQALSSRTLTIHQFDPSTVYRSLSEAPNAWSIFKYSPTSEIEPGRLYTPSEIHEYLYSNPLHTRPNGVHDPENGGLRLWIQRNPADSARRYPSSQSNRCRFAGCFATHNVINQGHVRVCFDETSHLGADTNPFHVSGYVHLNCLERFLDFPAICRDLAIQPDNRDLPYEPHGRNRMKLPDSAINLAFQFIRACKAGTLKGYPSGGRPHKGTLVWRLMSKKVELERHLYERQELKRGGMKGSQVRVHLGDLELESSVRDKTRKPEYQVQRHEVGPKRKAEVFEEESSDEDSEWERRTMRRKYPKRRRA
ncbi:MAG: hypothetical protein Q9219_004941 [cf. Caloplaca sp. 3 TL-2023]